MDIEEDPDLIYGEEFCFPAAATYYPTLHAPTGINVPAEFYECPTLSGFNNQGLHYSGHQAEGTSCMYYVVPEYGTAHPPHGHHPLHMIAHPSRGPHSLYLAAHPPHGSHPCAIANGRLSRGQEHCAETVEHTYYQQVRTSHYAVLPSAADGTTPINDQPLAYTSGLFLPGGSDQTVAAASERGVAWSSSLQSASVSSMKFQNRTVVPEGQPCGSDPWKRQPTGRSRFTAKPFRARQASRQSRQSAVPSVQSSMQTNFSCNNHVTTVGSDFCKMSAEKSHHCSKTSSYDNQRLSFLDQRNMSKQKPINLMPSEIILKSYTSRLHIGDPKGNIILRTDQYNRDDFRVVYPNAKFFVIKSFDEADVHKSIKYGVWSTSYLGNKKLDSAFREAQVIAANGSTTCPVFLFFSVNGSFRFCGVAEMVGPVDWQKDMDFWCTDKWIGSFPVKWHIIKNVYNSVLRSIMLQNNEDKPVTNSRDTQEIHYIPGTNMLKIFKCTRADEFLLDEFMMHEEKEARSSQHRRSKLRQAAPEFMPASMHASHSYNTLMTESPQLIPASMHAHQTCNTLQPPRSDSVVMSRITRETNDLTGKLQYLDSDRYQRSWKEFGSLATIASTTNTHSYGIQAHENIVKAMTRQAYQQPLTLNMKPASDGEQQCLKNVEITPTGEPQPEATTSLSFKAPEEYPDEGKHDLVHGASEVPEMISEEQKTIGKPCSLTTNSQSSQVCSKLRVATVAIGSMLVPITISNQ